MAPGVRSVMIEVRNFTKRYGDFVALEVPLQAAASVGTGSMSQRAFDAATELVLGMFRAGLQRL